MILVAGLSPAWQQILRFDRLRSGEVNRAAEAHWCASGKAVNVAWALHRLGEDVTLLTTAGGAAGQQLRAQVEAEGIAARWIEVKSATRVCTTIVETESSLITELVENTPPADAAELQAFQEEFTGLAAHADLVVLTGSLPQGARPTYYRELVQRTPCPVLLDIRGPELLAALECRPLLVKPNREELAHTVNQPEGVLDLDSGIKALRRGGAQWVVISDGAAGLRCVGPEVSLRVTPPSMQVVNPIGSGDCLLAGTAWGLARGRAMREAVVLGVAAGTVNVGHLLPARLDADSVQRLAASIAMENV